MEEQKRIRRKIGNDAIISGFQALRQLLPHQQGDNLSKSAILQQTAQNICALMEDKSQLLSQNSHLKRLLGQKQTKQGEETDPVPKRRMVVVDTEELNHVRIKLEREGKMIDLEPRQRNHLFSNESGPHELIGSSVNLFPGTLLYDESGPHNARVGSSSQIRLS